MVAIFIIKKEIKDIAEQYVASLYEHSFGDFFTIKLYPLNTIDYNLMEPTYLGTTTVVSDELLQSIDSISKTEPFLSSSRMKLVEVTDCYDEFLLLIKSMGLETEQDRGQL